MGNLLFRKISSDIAYFFLIASVSITLIIWVIQSVNYLDIVTEDGYSLKIYFVYSVLSLPKIFSKILIFIYFISCFFIINKYQENNEILVFWTNGIKKINLINFLLRFSIIFLVIQFILTVFLVPYTQNLSRIYIKNSNIDFLPKLLIEKKFINIFKNVTVFIDKFDRKGKITKIYINEKLDDNSSKIIMANKGEILKDNDQYILKLFDGNIINSNKNNFYNINFKETNYDLTNFSSKTVVHQKIQQVKSKNLLDCVYNFYFNKKVKNIECENRQIKSILEEAYKRIVMPLYIFILSLIASSLLIKPKSNKYIKYYKSLILCSGFLFVVISQLGFNLLVKNLTLDMLIIFCPLIFVFCFYVLIFFKSNFNFKYL